MEEGKIGIVLASIVAIVALVSLVLMYGSANGITGAPGTGKVCVRLVSAETGKVCDTPPRRDCTVGERVITVPQCPEERRAGDGQDCIPQSECDTVAILFCPPGTCGVGNTCQTVCPGKK